MKTELSFRKDRFAPFFSLPHQMRPKPRRLALLIVMGLIALMTGCGGGGGDDPSDPPDADDTRTWKMKR